VERASGLSLDEFIRTRITSPLGMRDTHFFLPLDKRARLATVYASDSTNHVTRAPTGPRGQGDYVDGPRRSYSGGAGLLSTARDYARFLEMMLERGALDGTRLLSPKTVDVMTTNQSGTLMSQTGLGFGLGFQTTERLGADGLASVGTYGWGGAYGSMYKVDPAEHIVIVFMINQLPNRTDVAAKFPTLVYQALVEARPLMGARAAP
jgi:CubicO group peptidase (beta-lactamase class C family)